MCATSDSEENSFFDSGAPDHCLFKCCACMQEPIMRFRWKCFDCKDSVINLCRSCYMADELNTCHAFERFDGPCDGG